MNSLKFKRFSNGCGRKKIYMTIWVGGSIFSFFFLYYVISLFKPFKICHIYWAKIAKWGQNKNLESFG